MIDDPLYNYYPVKPKTADIADFANPIRWCIKMIEAKDTLILKSYPKCINNRNHRRLLNRKTTEAQKRINDRNVRERFSLLLIMNFSSEDLFVTLTFAKDPVDKSKVLEKLKYFLKKLRKYSPGEIKYIGVIESITVAGDQVRSHIHLIISGTDYEMIKENWKYGLVDIEDPKDELNIAGYLCKAFEHTPEGEHHYTRSRNLEEPVVEIKTLDERNASDFDELEAIEKYPEAYIEEYLPDYELSSEPEIRTSNFMPGHYVRLEMCRKNCERNFAELRKKLYFLHMANQFLGLMPNHT